MQKKILTERLSLDLLTSGDADFIMELVNTKGWIEFIGDRNVHSKEQALAYIDKILANPNIFYWVVRTKESNTSIGLVSFLKRDYLDNFDIGFAFLPDFAGLGYAYEASRKVLSVIAENPGYHPVLATTIPGNERSIKLLLKLGLRFEKELQVEKEKLLIYTNSSINPPVS